MYNGEQDLLNDWIIDQPRSQFIHLTLLIICLRLFFRPETQQELLEKTHKKVQGKQKHDFDLRRLSSAKMEVVYKIMLKNKWRDDRKGGEFLYRWQGLYAVESGLKSLAKDTRIALKQ